jgi:hypothetical protein
MQGAVRYPGVFLRLNFGSPCRETQKRNEKSQPLPANPALPPPTTAISGGTSKGHAPHCTPKTAISTPLHLSPSTRLDESLVASTGLRKANQYLAHLALLVAPEALSRPLKSKKAPGWGRSPPCARPCAAARRQAELSREAPPPAEERGQLQHKTHRTRKPAPGHQFPLCVCARPTRLSGLCVASAKEKDAEFPPRQASLARSISEHQWEHQSVYRWARY